MSRIRTIKPQFFFNEDLAALAPLTRLFFIGLWTQVDREGRCEDRPARLKANLLPYEDANANEIIQELADRGHVIRYQVGELQILQVVNFLKHQRPHFKEDASILPPPSAESMNGPSMNHPCPMNDSIMNAGREGKGRERKGMDIAPNAAPERSRELTALQKVIRAFKEAKGLDADDAAWDKLHFKRFTRPANDIIKIFLGDANAAIVYTLKKGMELDEKGMTSWGLDAIARIAATDPDVLHHNGGDYGHEHSTVGADRLDGAGRRGDTTSSRALAGDTLRQIEHAHVQAQEAGDMGEAGQDRGRNGEDLS